MKKSIYLLRSLLCIASFLIQQPVNALEISPIKKEHSNSIILFMQPIIATEQENLDRFFEKVSHSLNEPGELDYWLLKQHVTSDDRGIYATYGGMVNRFNANGELIFPRDHQGETVTIIVTQNIQPIILHENTVSFFIRNEDYPIAYYQTTRQFDKAANIYYWDTAILPLPKNKTIPPSAIVIFAAPDQIKIPEGTTVTIGGPNLLLPPIYPTKKLSKSFINLNALSFLKINKYFAPVFQHKKYMKKRYAELIQA